MNRYNDKGKNQNIDISQTQCIEKGILKNPFLSFTLICRTRKEITKEPYFSYL